MTFLHLAVDHYRSTLCLVGLLILLGAYSFSSIPIESEPEVVVPYVYVGVRLEGASPEDGARLLARPVEHELRNIEGLDEIIATATESFVSILVSFETGAVDIDTAVREVREAVDRGKSEFPPETDEPIVEEIPASGYPTISLSIAGSPSTPERLLYQTAKQLQREMEALPNVLEAKLVGHREEVVEALIDPARLEYYNITGDELAAAVLGNNLLIPAGALEAGEGRFSVKVPGLIESWGDVYSIPVRANANGVITLGDVADIRRTFKDPESFTSVNGKAALLLQVEKRTGANQIEVSRLVRQRVAELSAQFPPGLDIGFALDMSYFSEAMVHEMSGNIITAMTLVMIVVVGALGFKSGLLVGIGIPATLLMSLIVLYLLGFSFNMMVMFGMLLALGMLIDGSIVITEYADRKMAEGQSSRDAYAFAVKRMFWPVVASVATTLAAFLPLLMWPGVAGDFMRYLPITVFSVLILSLLYALLLAPVAGSLMGRTNMDRRLREYLCSLEMDTPASLRGHTGSYAKIVSRVLQHPFAFVLAMVLLLVVIFGVYSRFNKGVEFFTDTEEKYGTVTVRAMGNLSVEESRRLELQVEQRVLQDEAVVSTYTTSRNSQGGQWRDEGAKDEIGNILVEIVNPDKLGYSSHRVFDRIRKNTADFPGIIVSAKPMQGGPPVGSPINIQLESNNSEKLLAATRYLRHYIANNVEGLIDLTDSTSLPGIEWQISVDRPRAAQLGVRVQDVGRAVQLVTSGVRVGEYRPDDADDEVEIRVRYPVADRGLLALDNLRVATPNGPVPISSFVRREARSAVDKVERIDAVQVMSIKADVEAGLLVDDKVQEIRRLIDSTDIGSDVRVVFRGANEEQEKSSRFLQVAFSLALFLMFILLVTQFNSFYQGLLILSSVIMSTAGVLLGLLMMDQTFSIVLTGVGIVALAGIVVNNNIVLIDTYNVVRRESPGLSSADAALRASVQRLRPIFLTTITTVLGLLPMALGVSIDLVARAITVDGVVTSMYQPLASAIVSGLIFSTLLTLTVTPAMLVLPDRLRQMCRRWFGSNKRAQDNPSVGA